MKILIADDEVEATEVLVKYLKKRAAVVDSVADGEDALRLIKKQEYDLIISDINMPGLTGLEILRYVKDNHLKAKVVLLTGYPCVDSNLAKTLRADEYLEKPTALEAIGKIVEKYTPSDQG